MIDETVIQVIQRFYHYRHIIIMTIILTIVIVVVIEIFVGEKLHGGQIV